MNNSLNQQVYTFYTEHHKAFYRYALSYLKNSSDAQDIVHSSIEKLVELVEKKNKLPGYSFQFVIRCIKNMSIDKIRGQQTRQQAEIQLKNIINYEKASDGQILLSECFSVLPENQKEVIILKAILGYTFREIGKIKGVSLFTVASWYRTGIKRLETLISKEMSK